MKALVERYYGFGALVFQIAHVAECYSCSAVDVSRGGMPEDPIHRGSRPAPTLVSLRSNSSTTVVG